MPLQEYHAVCTDCEKRFKIKKTDCDDLALYQYKLLDTLGIDTEIKYNGSHVWVMPWCGSGEYREASLSELEHWVQLDKED